LIFLFIKWRLTLKTLPWVGFVLLLAFIRAEVLEITPVFDFSEITPFITVTSLVIGFTLASVMGGYREAERLPSEIACSVQAIDDCIKADENHLSADIYVTLKKLNLDLCHSILEFLKNKNGIENTDVALQNMVGYQTSLNFKKNVLRHIDSIRRNLTRVDVIRSTNFIRSGYALLELIVTITLFFLILTNFKKSIDYYCIIGFISLIYMYIIGLIQELDKPFYYKFDGSGTASTVNYSPISDVLHRLKKSQL
jgi:hypothetical protein